MPTIPIPKPDDILNLDTGTITIGRTTDHDLPAFWQLWTPGGGAAHGVIVNKAGQGGTNLLRVLAHSVQTTNAVTCWIMDACFGQERALDMLAAAEAIAFRRRQTLDGARWSAPTSDMPLLLVLIDDVDRLLQVSRERLSRLLRIGPDTGPTSMLRHPWLPPDVHNRVVFNGRGTATWAHFGKSAFQVYYCPAMPAAQWIAYVAPSPEEAAGMLAAATSGLPTPRPWKQRLLRAARAVRRWTPSVLRVAGLFIRFTASALVIPSGILALFTAGCWIALPQMMARHAADVTRHQVAAALILTAVAAALVGAVMTVVEIFERRCRQRAADAFTTRYQEGLGELRSIAGTLRGLASLQRAASRSRR